MQDYMGTYVACMLSSGELPGLKGEDKLKDANSQCSVSFGAGKGTAGGTGANGNNQNGENGNSNGSGADGKNGNSANKNAKNNKSGSGSGSDGSNASGGSGSSGNYYAGSQSRRAMFGRSRMMSSDGGESSDSGNQKRYVNALNGKGDRFFRQRNQSTPLSMNNGRGLAISGFTEEMRKKQERKIQSEPRVLPKSESEDFSKPERRSIVKPPPPVKKVELQKDEEVTFGSFFKYIFIAVIILLIIILGGGQMFEMSKSYD